MSPVDGLPADGVPCALVREHVFAGKDDAYGGPRLNHERLSRHLASCAECAQLRERAEALLQGTRAALPTTLPAELGARVWRQVQSSAGRAAASNATSPAALRWPRWWAGLGLAAAAALFLLLPGPPSAPMAIAVIDSETVDRMVDGSGTFTALNSAEVHPGDRFRSGAGGSLRLQVGTSQVILGPDSVMAIERQGDTVVLLRLEHGRLSLAQVQGSAQPIETAVLSVVIAGAVFRGPLESADSTAVVFELTTTEAGDEVQVLSGRLRYGVREQPAEARAGLRYRLGGADGPQAVAPQASTSRRLAAAFGLQAPNAAEGEGANEETGNGTPGASTEPRDRSRAEDRAQDKAKWRRPRPAVERALLVKHDRWAEVSQVLLQGKCPAARALLNAMPIRAADGLQAEVTVWLGDCYYRRNDLDQALSVYRSARDQFGNSPAAHNAAYECGRVASELGRKHQALASFAEYLRRFPRGVLRHEAEQRLCVLAGEGTAPRDGVSRRQVKKRCR